jgi:hypothetical protein
MDVYLIACDDWQRMEERPGIICQQFEVLVGGTARYLAPVLFAEYSCLTQFVREEIDLVVSSQSRRNAAHLDYDAFVELWGWRDKLDTKVYNLSGGWRKALACSLFVNQKCDNLLFVDFSSHLSDKMISFIVARMGRLNIASIAFVEYDDSILAAHLLKPRRLRTSGQRLTESL